MFNEAGGGQIEFNRVIAEGTDLVKKEELLMEERETGFAGKVLKKLDTLKDEAFKSQLAKLIDERKNEVERVKAHLKGGGSSKDKALNVKVNQIEIEFTRLKSRLAKDKKVEVQPKVVDEGTQVAEEKPHYWYDDM